MIQGGDSFWCRGYTQWFISTLPRVHTCAWSSCECKANGNAPRTARPWLPTGPRLQILIGPAVHTKANRTTTTCHTRHGPTGYDPCMHFYALHHHDMALCTAPLLGMGVGMGNGAYGQYHNARVLKAHAKDLIVHHVVHVCNRGYKLPETSHTSQVALLKYLVILQSCSSSNSCY